MSLLNRLEGASTADPFAWLKRFRDPGSVIADWAKVFENDPYLEQEVADSEALVDRVHLTDDDALSLSKLVNQSTASRDVRALLTATIKYSSLPPIEKDRLKFEASETDTRSVNLWRENHGKYLYKKMYFSPAYVKAFAPFVASVINFIGKKAIYLLVVGGGNGFFSRYVKPEVENLLLSKGNTAFLNVRESDCSSVIHQAPAKTNVVYAEQLLSVFPRKRFDIVISEDSLGSQNGKPDLLLHLDSIRGVLKEDGSHLNTMGNTPTYYTNATRKIANDFGFPDESTVYSFADFLPVAEQAASKITDFMYLSFLNALRECSSGPLWSYGDRQFQSRKNLPIDYVDPFFDRKELSGNSMIYAEGTIHNKKSDEVPSGEIELGYDGYMSIMTRQPDAQKMFDQMANDWAYTFISRQDCFPL